MVSESSGGTVRNVRECVVRPHGLDQRAAVRRGLHRVMELEIVVGHEAGKAAFVLVDQRAFPRDDIVAPDVVPLGIAVVEADQDFVGVLYAGAENDGAGFFERGQIARDARFRIGRIKQEIFRAAFVLQIKDVTGILRPIIFADRAFLFIGHGLGLAKIGAHRRDPDVQHAVFGREKADLRSIGANARGRALRIAEDDLAGDERVRFHLVVMFLCRGAKGRCERHNKKRGKAGCKTIETHGLSPIEVQKPPAVARHSFHISRPP